MANITENRINLTIAAADLTAIAAAINTINTKLPFLQALTDEERAALLGLDVNNKVFVDEALDEMTNNDSILPAFINTANLNNDIKLFEQLSTLESTLSNLLTKISDTKRIAGHEAYAVALTAYNMYGMASSAGIPNARQSYDRLKTRFSGQGRTSNPTP